MAEFRMDLKRVKQVMNTYGDQVVREMITRLTGFGKIASGELAQSLGYTFIQEGDDLVLTFLAAPHWIYVDQGRKPGQMPPVSAIRQWCRIKGIDEAAAYPIARNIGRYGIPPTNYHTISTTRRLKQYQAKRDEALRLDIADAATMIAREELKKKKK